MYKIEKGIDRPRRGGYGRYPFSKMEVEDSFFVPKESDDSIKNITANAHNWSKKFYNGERKFSYRKVDGGHRIWRIK